ncbi:hypothetical protein, partial [Sinorhizobium meliloti]|uniref:hypothetical protein n=1 Tax=Rhizobium meliloti TaxID=382 RepID=UPI001AEDEE29
AWHEFCATTPGMHAAGHSCVLVKWSNQGGKRYEKDKEKKFFVKRIRGAKGGFGKADFRRRQEFIPPASR